MKHVFRFLGRLEGDAWVIDDESEVEHIRKVLRLVEGTEIEVFDGRGAWGSGRIETVGKERVDVIVAQQETTTRPGRALSIAIGAVKPGDMDDVIPALTELGADAIHVFYQEGGDPGRMGPKVQERWRRIVLAAAKQCKRAWLPEIHSHESLRSLLATTSKVGGKFFGAAGADKKLLAQEVGDGGCLVVLGSERGLNAEEEKVLVEAGFEAVTFGEYVLRARTAAIAAMAILASRRG